jgi:hypothetical protein
MVVVFRCSCGARMTYQQEIASRNLSVPSLKSVVKNTVFVVRISPKPHKLLVYVRS